MRGWASPGLAQAGLGFRIAVLGLRIAGLGLRIAVLYRSFLQRCFAGLGSEPGGGWLAVAPHSVAPFYYLWLQTRLPTRRWRIVSLLFTASLPSPCRKKGPCRRKHSRFWEARAMEGLEELT